MACQTPSGISKCPPIPTYGIGGVAYFYTVVCDANGDAFYQVVEVCDGVPTDVISYFNLQWEPGEPVLPIGQCPVELGAVTVEGAIQYTEGDVDATITGTAVMWEDAADTLRVASAANPLPVDVDTSLLATAANQATGNATLTSIDSRVDGLEAELAQKTEPADTQTVRDTWRVSTLNFTTADDSDVTFTVPASTEYQILSVYVSLVTTATVGSRQMSVQALDASDNILIGARARVVQAASLTRVYNFAPGLPNDTAFYDTDYLAVSLPPIFLTAGQKLRVWDKAAVAATADDMVVRVQIASRSIA